MVKVEKDMSKLDRKTRKYLRLVHTNRSVTRVIIYPWIELNFDNIYFSSTYFNLSIHGFTGSNRSTTIRISPIETDSFYGKMPLLIHVVLIIVVGLVCAFIFYGCIKGQTDEKVREVAEDISKNADIEQTLLLAKTDVGKVVELNEAEEQIRSTPIYDDEN